MHPRSHCTLTLNPLGEEQIDRGTWCLLADKLGADLHSMSIILHLQQPHAAILDSHFDVLATCRSQVGV